MYVGSGTLKLWTQVAHIWKVGGFWFESQLGPTFSVVCFQWKFVNNISNFNSKIIIYLLVTLKKLLLWEVKVLRNPFIVVPGCVSCRQNPLTIPEIFMFYDWQDKQLKKVGCCQFPTTCRCQNKCQFAQHEYRVLNNCWSVF